VTNYTAKANTNVFSSNLTSTINGFFYISMVTNSTSVANLVFNGITMALNNNNNLIPNTGYTFAMPMISGDNINIKFNVTSVVSVWVDQGAV
jgi:hypothetical protein